jgi:hypothetical protein
MNNSYQRPYTYSDPEATTIATRICELHTRHMARFTAFDPELGPAFSAAWRQTIADAIATTTDETARDHLQMLSTITDDRMAQCARAARDLRYYVELAFGSTPVLRAFGFARLSRQRHAPAQYAVSMRTLHRLAQQFATELTAQGLTPAHLQALADTATALLQAEEEQELYKCQRMLLTQHRKDTFTALWAFVQRTQRAAQVIFAEEDEMRQLFVP